MPTLLMEARQVQASSRRDHRKCVDPDGRRRSEMTLVRELQNGNRRAERRFVRENQGWMKALARRYVLCDSASEDVVQDSFANVFRCLGQFEGRGSLKTWLYRVTVHAAISHLRRSRRLADTLSAEDVDLDQAKPDLADAPLSLCLDPYEALDRKQRCAMVRTCIAQLPMSQREIVHLRDLEEQNTKDVARQLGLTEANAKVRLHRARKSLRSTLMPELLADGV